MIHNTLTVTMARVPNKVINDFIRECKILSALRHPNIVQFVGISKDGRILMECVHSSLNDYIDKDIKALKHLNTLPLEQKLKILYEVALGLQYLHERDTPILHRDLTARNILLTNDLQAKIADLGQAIIKQHNHEQYLTQAPGVLCYMPPEVLKSNPKYDQSIDIFSFGVLILHTISEVLPAPELDAQILNDQSGDVMGSRSEFERRPSSVSKLNTMPQLTSLVEQCLHNSAKHRPPVMLVVGRLALAISDEKNSRDNILAVSYFNKELDLTNYNLKITLARGISRVNKLCVIIRSPITFGFTGTYKGTIPFPRTFMLSSPRDITVTADDNMYVCDYNGYISVFAYVLEGTTHIVKPMVQAAPILSPGKPSDRRCWYPQGIASDDHGNVYVTDLNRVLKYSSTFELLEHVGGMAVSGSGPKHFNQPSGIAVNGEFVYVCDTNNCRVRILDSCHLDVIGEFRHDDMRPIDIAINKGGKYLYILDCKNRKVCIFREGNHELLRTIDLKESQYLNLRKPVGICVDTKNFIYITDQQKHGVMVVDATGNFKMFFGIQGSNEGEFNSPSGIDIDNQGNVYVCDSENKRVQVFS